MQRSYHKVFSPALEREMELLVFGHAGSPVLVFPTSGGRFYEFEDCGMIAALAPKIDTGALRLYCLDALDHESWYNRRITPPERIRRHMQFEQYVVEEVVPFVRKSSGGQDLNKGLTALGCSLGGYHALNLALRHPEVFTGMISLSGAFDLSFFLDRYCDENCYLHLPTYYLPNLTDPLFLGRLRQNRLVLATGWDDQCLEQNRQMAHLLTEKQIPHQFHVWEAENTHDWPTWQRMGAEYL
jgi:esterase/lipase superfamily enzyme